MSKVEPQSALQAAELLMAHGAKANEFITFRPENSEVAAEAVEHLANCLANLPGAVRDSLERGRNSAAMLSSDRLQCLSEMIQNADDAGAEQVRITLLPDGLWLSHDGEPIQLQHIFGIAMPWITTKSDDPDAIGRHGIGLMTLRSLSSTLQVHCSPYHVQLDEFSLSVIQAVHPPTWLAMNSWTALHVPLDKKILNLDSLKAWLENWGHAGLLFLRSVTNISLYDFDGNIVFELCLRWRHDTCLKQYIGGEDVSLNISLADDPDGRSFRVYKVVLTSPEETNRHGKSKSNYTSLAIALPLNDSQDNWLHAGLPVIKTQIRARIGAQFDTLSNRQALAMNDWNLWLIEAIAQLWLLSIANLLETETVLAWRLIPNKAPENVLGTSLVADLEHKIWEVAGKPLSEIARIMIGKDYVAIEQLAVEVPELESVLESSEIATLAGCEYALPSGLRDTDRNWWSVLEFWRRECGWINAPVSIEDALALLNDSSFPVKRRIEFSAIAIEENMGSILAQRPCVALANGQIIPPPHAHSPEVLLLNVSTLAETLGIGLHMHPIYSESSHATTSVLDWLRTREAFLDNNSTLALLNRIAKAGTHGQYIFKALTESQLASLRDAFETILPEQQQSLGPAVGRAIRLMAVTFDDNKKEVSVECSPAQAYLPREIDRESESFAIAAAQTPEIYWISAKYAVTLRSHLGRAGLGAQRFLRMLGSELAPRIIKHPGLIARYTGSPKGLLINEGPAKRIAAMKAIDADFTLEDWESPDLQRVVVDIASETKITQRKARSSALIASLSRAWEQRLVHCSTVTAALADYGWQKRGVLRAYWLWAAGNIEWLDDIKDSRRRPCDLLLRTPASVAIYGKERNNYLSSDLQTISRHQVLEALGVEGEASTAELIRHLEYLRAKTAGIIDKQWETETAVVYQALAARFPNGRSAPDMNLQTLKREFSVPPGLILSKRGWRRPGEVLLDPPSFGNYRDYIPSVPNTENLWRALQIRQTTVDDCIAVLKEVMQRRKTLEGEEVAVVIAALNVLQLQVSTVKNNTQLTRSMRKLPLWTSQGWIRSRPVYAVADTSIAQALASRLPIWIPGCEIANINDCMALLSVTVIEVEDTHIAHPEDAETDELATGIFKQTVLHLHEDLSRNDPHVAAALNIKWELLKRFEVKLDPDLRVRISSVTGWSEKEMVPVRAKADVDRLALFLRSSHELQRVESAGRAIASLFKADPRKIAHAWIAAYDKTQEGIDAKEIVAAEEAQKLDQEKLAEDVLARTRQLQMDTAKKRTTKVGKISYQNVLPSASESRAIVPPLPPRVLVDPDKLLLKQPLGEIYEKTQSPPLVNKRQQLKLPNPRNGHSSPQDRKSLPTFSGITKETLGLELVRRALQYESGELRDLRAQMGLGADAVDSEGRFFELKVYLHDEPNTIRFTDSEVKRAASTSRFYLVIVSNIEGNQAKPRVRIIAEPLKQLSVTGNGGVTFTNVSNAASLVFNYEHLIE